jgi:amino acid transporter
MKSDDQVGVSEDKSHGPMYEKDGLRTSSSDAEIGHGDLVPEETTKRGLKARHAQMIALGGTIGK